MKFFNLKMQKMVSYKVNENKYVGYKLSESNVKTEAKDGEVFTVKYVKDDICKR